METGSAWSPQGWVVSAQRREIQCMESQSYWDVPLEFILPGLWESAFPQQQLGDECVQDLRTGALTIPEKTMQHMNRSC